MGLGSLMALSVAEAREKAAVCRRRLASGLDPIEARDADRAERAAEAARTLGFAECAERFIATHEAAGEIRSMRRNGAARLKLTAAPSLVSCRSNRLIPSWY